MSYAATGFKVKIEIAGVVPHVLPREKTSNLKSLTRMYNIHATGPSSTKITRPQQWRHQGAYAPAPSNCLRPRQKKFAHAHRSQSVEGIKNMRAALPSLRTREREPKACPSRRRRLTREMTTHPPPRRGSRTAVNQTARAAPKANSFHDTPKRHKTFLRLLLLLVPSIHEKFNRLRGRLHYTRRVAAQRK